MKSSLRSCLPCVSVLAVVIALPVCAADAPTVFDPQTLFAPLTLPTPANAYRSGSGVPGPMYWQNRADYDIHASIDPAHKTLSGDEVIRYTNNSPDTLDVLWLQMDQNIYRRDSRSSVASVWPRQHFTKGYQLTAVAVDSGGGSQPVHYVVDDTRMRVDLPRPLAGHGATLKLHIRYHYTLPGTWGGRTAVTPTKNGDIYEIAQWYPRMAVYDDLRGWDTLPYIAAEFYLEYGDIDYSVTVPWNYLVVGSGKLTNPDQVLTDTERRRLAEAAGSDDTVTIRGAAQVNDPSTRPTHHGTQTWHFHMDHTRDVAFAASPAFIWDAARINLPGGKHALAMSAYPVEAAGSGKWARSTEYVKNAVEYFSKTWGFDYPWPVAVNVAGHGANMEYPGFVLDGIKDDGPRLFWVTTHEIGHSWFPMIVGSNERRHAFMDEGFNTFIDVYASDAFNHGEFAPKRDQEYAPQGGNPVDDILPLLADPDAPTLMAPADALSFKYWHSVSYFKCALGLVLLREQILGPQRFDQAFRKYIDAWAWKHPSPSDFFRLMDSEAGEDLSWFWRGWFFHNWQMDMGVSGAAYVDNNPAKGVMVTLQSRQKLVMPATLRIVFADGSHQDIRVPEEAWQQQVAPKLILPTTRPIKSLTLDPDHKLPDADRSNNRFDM